MPRGAPRPRSRQPFGFSRGAVLAAVLAAAGAGALPADVAAETIAAARYAEPTTRYPHGALGDDAEWGAMEIELASGDVRLLRLPSSRVFEDVAPRLVDLDGDAIPEIVVVESDASRGARLAVYGSEGLLAATPFIGQRNRWLAPLGTADLDGDGAVEIAYVDRPHLARILRVWRYRDGVLTEVAAQGGHTNHRFGAPGIGGGIRDCGAGPEIVTASADWTRLLATRLQDGRLASRDIGPWSGSFDAALACS